MSSLGWWMSRVMYPITLKLFWPGCSLAGSWKKDDKSLVCSEMAVLGGLSLEGPSTYMQLAICIYVYVYTHTYIYT